MDRQFDAIGELRRAEAAASAEADRLREGARAMEERMAAIFRSAEGDEETRRRRERDVAERDATIGRLQEEVARLTNKSSGDLAALERAVREARVREDDLKKQLADLESRHSGDRAARDEAKREARGMEEQLYFLQRRYTQLVVELNAEKEARLRATSDARRAADDVARAAYGSPRGGGVLGVSGGVGAVGGFGGGGSPNRGTPSRRFGSSFS
jgi:chromosome segregation ATPase